MKEFFGLFLCGLAVTSLFARPAAPDVVLSVANGDGELSVVNHGDEHYHFSTTEDGFLVVPQNGLYVYADSNGEASDVIARNEADRSASDLEFLKRLGESGKSRSFEMHKEKAQDRFPDEENRPGALLLKASDVPQPELRPAAEKWTSGKRYVPVLLVGTTDVAYADSLAVYNLLNKEGYNLNGTLGSLRDYYLYSSGGALDITFDVYPLQLGVAQTSFGYDNSFNEGKYVSAGLDALVKHPEFAKNASKYCFSGTFVDAFMFLFPGKEVDALKQSSSFWGHKYQMIYNGSASWGKGYVAGGYTFDSYLFIAQMHDKYDQLNAMGIFAHEFSHVLGLKDLYASLSNGTMIQGPYPYDVMTRGMYNGNWQVPPSFSAAEREWMGWMKLQEAEADSVYTIRDISRMEAFSVSNPNQPDEYYVVEYRPAIMYDAQIKDNGAYVWYIDYDEYTFNNGKINGDASHPRVAVKKVVKKDGYYADFTYVNKGGVAEIPGVYNFVFEGDSVACFTTNSSRKITSCPKTQAVVSSSSVSSSSEVQSSSSAPIVSSSSVVSEIAMPAVASGIQMRLEGMTLHVTSVGQGSKQIVVFDMLGNKVLTDYFLESDYSVSLNSVGRGAYMIQIVAHRKIIAQQMLKVSGK